MLRMSKSVRCRDAVRSVLSWMFGVGSDGITIPEALRIVDRGVGTNRAAATGRVGRGGAAGPVV